VFRQITSNCQLLFIAAALVGGMALPVGAQVESIPSTGAKVVPLPPIDAGKSDAGEINAGEIDAIEIDAGEIDAGEIDAGEINAGEIDAGENHTRGSEGSRDPIEVAYPHYPSGALSTKPLVAHQDDRPLGLPTDDESSGGVVGSAASGEFGEPVDAAPVWWNEEVRSELGLGSSSLNLSLDELIFTTLRFSPRIRAVSQTPLIRETELNQAVAEFDPELFVRTRFDDRHDPVGNILTTLEPFLEEHTWSGAAGFRRKLLTGGSIDMEQQLGFQNSNARFFDPQDQGTATLLLNFSQPLLRGRGRLVTTSQIVLAEVQSGVAWNEFSEQLQDELLQATQAYWDLWYRRSLLLQQQRNVARGQEVFARLDARADFDAVPSQITRARAAIERRRTELANAERDVKNAETEIRRITACPDWQNSLTIELLPTEPATGLYQPSDMQRTVWTALQHRPEIQRAIQRSRGAAVSADVGRNELLPELTLLFGAYASGLEGESGVLSAWSEQFFNTTPGFYGGLEYTIPYGNRAARNRYVQRRLQLAQIRYEVQRVTQDVIADAQVAARQLNAAFQTSQYSLAALQAAREDLQQHRQRWETFGLVEGDIVNGFSAATALDQLLTSQQRLADAEQVYAQAIVDLKVAEVVLRKATGTLLIHEQVTIQRNGEQGLPQVELTRAGNSP